MSRTFKTLMQEFARQAIEVKYLGPTNHRGTRVRASCAGGSVILNWDHALDSFENHVAAAEALLIKLRWDGTNEMLGGQLKNGTYVFTLAMKQIKKNLGGAK